MAKYIGLITSDMRGKIGGIVASRSIGGTTMKAKRVPRVGASLLQQQRRVTFAAALNAWRNLTYTERGGWTTGALSLTWTTSLAVSFTPTGLQLWQQAFVNAAAFGTTPPGTYSGAPAEIVPIVNATLTGMAGLYSLLVYPAFGSYTGAWCAYMSPIIPFTRNYVKTISRKLCGANNGGNLLTLNSTFEEIWGPLPAPGPTVALRVLAVHPTTYVSGNPLDITTEFAA